MFPFIISALLSAGSAMAASKAQKKGAEQAGSALQASQQASIDYQEKASRANQALIKDAETYGLSQITGGFGRAREQLQPFAGMEEYEAARGLLQDPSSLMDRPGVRFQQEEGNRALQAAYSRASGGGVSGPAIEAAQQYGQNFAAQTLDQELNRLFPFISMSAQAREGMGNLEAQQAIAASNLRMGGATQATNLAAQSAQNVAQSMQQKGNYAAQQATARTNAQSGLYTSLGEIGSQSFGKFSQY